MKEEIIALLPKKGFITTGTFNLKFKEKIEITITPASEIWDTLMVTITEGDNKSQVNTPEQTAHFMGCDEQTGVLIYRMPAPIKRAYDYIHLRVEGGIIYGQVVRHRGGTDGFNFKYNP